LASSGRRGAGRRPQGPHLRLVLCLLSPVEELTKLAGMLEKGLLNREEFNLMKAKILGPPTI